MQQVGDKAIFFILTRESSFNLEAPTDFVHCSSFLTRRDCKDSIVLHGFRLLKCLSSSKSLKNVI